MARSTPPPKATVVALPVYGTRVLPRFGIAREFLVAEVDPLAPAVRSATRHAWDPCAAPSLPAWLHGLGATGVICGGIHPRFRVELETADLWVLWGQQGDAEEVVRRWARGEVSTRGDVYDCLGQQQRTCTRRRLP
ncbi:MAG: NifB/NifX family molybdenum-iron cluster-binding protein [Deltaproteobacteria bacterium]|nr:NifB/NifX family molybdenum-iron cluster-binding protein [Deltaproteobacteria bacterium]